MRIVESKVVPLFTVVSICFSQKRFVIISYDDWTLIWLEVEHLTQCSLWLYLLLIYYMN